MLGPIFNISTNNSNSHSNYLGEFETEAVLEAAHPNPVSESSATINPPDSDPYTAYWDDNASPPAWKYGNAAISQSNNYKIGTASQNKIITLSDNDTIIKATALMNLIIPNDTTEDLPEGFKTILKRVTPSIVSYMEQQGVTVEKPANFDAQIAQQNRGVELVKEGPNTWGVYGALKPSNEETGSLLYPLVLNVSQSALNHLAWAYVYKSSDYPLVTTTKDYFCIYSTDHDSNANGAIAWGEMDDPEFNGFEELGIIVQNGHQSEFADLIFIPASESGLANDELFLYFHTNNEPGHTLNQETRLWTTVGGAPLHTAVWTDRGRPITPESGDNHTGYLRMWKKGVGDYVAHHIIIQSGAMPFPNQQVYATSTDGLNFNRGATFTLNDNMPPGGTFWRHDINPFTHNGTLYGLINYQNAGNIFLALVELNPTSYLPETFVKTIVQLTFSDYTMYENDGIIYVYFRNKDFDNATFPIQNSLYLLKVHIEDIV